MKYSRNKLNQIGKKLVSPSIDLLDHVQNITIVEDWRKLHMEPLNELVDGVSSLLDSSAVPVLFFSQRLKRMTSIVGKLRRNPEMGLGGIQDIGGARFVFPNINALDEARRLIENASFDHFSLARIPYDYVLHPKKSGYRSIHFVYKYHSDNPDLDGLSVELQIRTQLQHDWATAVETAELISNSSLKASQGDENWLYFFKLVSAIFARKENMPVNEEFATYSEKDFCVAYHQLNAEHKFLDQLVALVGAVDIASKRALGKGYAVLLIQFAEKTVRFHHFKNEELEQANALYSKLESSVEKESGAVVLVSVSDMKELQEAYPSYFLNAKEFIDALSLFDKECQVKGYIPGDASYEN